jgi:lysyl-tRNA synthetase class 2
MNWQLAKRRHNLQQRARILQTVRTFFDTAGFLEIETPLRIPAPAPEVHIEAIPSDGWFLQTSPELCMKRLLAADYELIYQISHCWRAHERGSRHLSEFTMLEWYRAQADYSDLMTDCSGLLRAIAMALGNSAIITFQGQRINLTGQWERMTVREAFIAHGGMSMEEALDRDCFDEVMVALIEPQLGQLTPTFLYDYPVSRASLARIKDTDPSLAERFELYVAGMELANGFSELVDPIEQHVRFAAEESLRRSQGRSPYPVAEKFLSELVNMPPAAGIALGVDRLVMLLVDAQNINEVVAFTTEEL